MSFNQNAFNRAPFNLSEAGNVQWLSLDGYENVDCFVGAAVEVYLFCIPNERVITSIHGERFKQFEALGHEVIGYNVALEGTYWMDVQSNELLHTYTLLSSEMTLRVAGEERMSDELFLGCHVSTSASFSEIITPDVIWHVDYFTAGAGNELVSQTVDVMAIDEIICELNLTLMPGQRLIVDASNYNVLVDGENMIYTQVGEWLDELTRETNSITITAAEGGGGISANILYTERFL